MRTKHPINKYFQYLDIDNNKAYIDKKVHHRSKRTFGHFGLTQGDLSHCFPSFGWIIRAVGIAAKQYVSPDLTHIFAKKINCRRQDDDKYDLSNHYACIVNFPKVNF